MKTHLENIKMGHLETFFKLGDSSKPTLSSQQICFLWIDMFRQNTFHCKIPDLLYQGSPELKARATASLARQSSPVAGSCNTKPPWIKYEVGQVTYAEQWVTYETPQQSLPERYKCSTPNIYFKKTKQDTTSTVSSSYTFRYQGGNVHTHQSLSDSTLLNPNIWSK